MKQKKYVNDLLETIRKKEKRKRYAKEHKKSWVYWMGFAVFGVIGWLVMIPMLLGLGVGIWIDRTWSSRFSWTLILAIGGLMLGCFSAWLWVSAERKKIGNGKSRDGK